MNASAPDLFAFSEAKARRDAGMAQAEAHAPGFSALAYAAIERVARRQGSVHVDDVIAEGLPPAPHPNVWGAVWARAIRAGLIARTTETRPCRRDPKKHAHRYPVYLSRVALAATHPEPDER